MEGLLGLAATIAGQQHPLLVDALTAATSVALVGFFAIATWPRLRRGELSRADGVAAVCLGLVLDPHLYAQDCVLLLVALALVLRNARDPRTRLWLVLGCAAVMDLTALDTLWTSGMPLFPPHLFTLALVAMMVLLLIRQRVAHVRPRETRALAGVAS